MRYDIYELTQRWIHTVSRHPDVQEDDLHFYIVQYYSYGNKPYWSIEHHGDIAGRFKASFVRYDLAASELKRRLIQLLEDHEYRY